MPSGCAGCCKKRSTESQQFESSQAQGDMVHPVAESRHTHAEKLESSRSQNHMEKDVSRLPQRGSPGAFHGAAPALACALALCFLNDASSFHISATMRCIRTCSGSLGRAGKPQKSLLAQTRSFALLASQPLAAKPHSGEERRSGRAVRLAQIVGDPDEKGGVAVALRTLFRAMAVLFRQTMRVLNRIDVQLVVYFVLWYSGNYYHNITGKKALVMTGGAAGMPVTIATMQMGIGCIYALFLWAAPDARKFPKINFLDVTKMIPVAFCNAGVHGFSSFATSAGEIPAQTDQREGQNFNFQVPISKCLPPRPRPYSSCVFLG